jgi:hypothetical protein
MPFCALSLTMLEVKVKLACRFWGTFVVETARRFAKPKRI